jgi:tryptophanyl-tRNA synthetase
VVEKIAPIGDELRRLEADPGFLQQVLNDGAERAAATADPIVKQVKEIVGFVV